MTFNRTIRRLVFSGAVIGTIAVSGCATTQTASTVPAPAASATARADAAPAETLVQRCQRTWRTRVQDCITEGVVSSCRERNSGNEEGFISCVSEGLVTSQPAAPPETRQVSVTVTAGDEVFSLRSGTAVMMDVARLEATAVDVNGIAFTFTIERLATAAPSQRTQVEQTNVRFNFDGTTTGDIWKLQTLPVWNFRVQTVASDRATVSFETNDPGLLAKPPAQPSPAGSAAQPAAPAQKKK